jgi:ATP-dependent Clp protease protease subunit
MYIHGLILDDSYKGYFWDGDNTAGYVMPIDIRNILSELDTRDVNVYLNSDGGFVAAGIAIANMIARHKGKTTCYIDGWAASIASVIAMSCDNVVMPKNTFLMIHKPSCEVSGNSDDFDHAAAYLRTIQEGMEQTYQAKARDGITPEVITQYVNDETWFTADEAAEVFNIEVIEPQIQAAACAGSISNTFKKVPKSLLESQIFKKIEQKSVEDNKKPLTFNKERAFILQALANE